MGILDMFYILDPDKVLDKRCTATPPNRNVSGYGCKIPTGWLLKLTDKRWRRVYVVCYSNSGSAYVLVKGKRLWLGSYDPGD